MKFIVAGNHNVYQNWLHEKRYTPQEYRYVTSSDILRGRINIEGFYIGTYKERKDIEEIQMIIKTSKRAPKSPTKPITGAARINTTTGLTQYYDGNAWVDMGIN